MLRLLIAIALLVVVVAAVASQASDLATDARGPSSFQVVPEVILPTPVAEGDERAPVDESTGPSAGDAGEDSPRERVPAP